MQKSARLNATEFLVKNKFETHKSESDEEMQAEVKEEPKDVNSDQSEDLEDWLDTVI